MSLKKATPKAVFAACEQLELLDRSWNRDDVRLAIGGGSFSVIDPLIQAWRKLQPIREVAPTVPTDLLIQVATMLEQQVSDYITDIDARDTEREITLLNASEVLAANLQQIESELTGQLEITQQANHDLEAECSRLENELGEKVQTASSLEAQLSISEEAIASLNSRIKEQKEFYESGLKLQKQGQQENETRLIEQGQQQVSQLKLEYQQQLAQQKSELNDVAELAENRLMRLLDEARNELKEVQLGSEGKLNVLRGQIQEIEKISTRQKLKLNSSESELREVTSTLEQKSTILTNELSKSQQECRQLREQSAHLESKIDAEGKEDLKAIRKLVQSLQDQAAKQ